jgi:HlyD family secretion protein
LSAAAAAVAAQQAEAGAASDAVRAARAEVAAAEARLVEATANLSRVKQLHAEALTPRSELDAAQAAFDAARAQAESSRASLERAGSAQSASSRRTEQARAQAARARDIVSKTEITSPIDGVVSRLQVREGEMVVIGIQNQPGTTLMTVSDLSDIDAEVKVAEADVLRLKIGQRAEVVLEAIPGRRLPGRVVEIGASALPVVGTQAAAREFKVVVRLDQPDASLRPGLTCDVDILTEERQNVLTVPLQSVVLRPAADAGSSTGAGTVSEGRDRPGVFAVEGDRVRFQPVTTGIIGGLAIEVDGLAEGTRVVTGPFQALRELQDGSRIRLADSR